MLIPMEGLDGYAYLWALAPLAGRIGRVGGPGALF